MTRELALGIGTLAIAAGYYAMAAAIPDSLLADEVGPEALPVVYSLLLAAFSLGLIVSSLMGGRRPAGDRHAARRANSVPPVPRRAGHGAESAPARAAGMFLIGVTYVVAVPWLGYALSLAGLIVATVWYQSREVTRRPVFVAVAGAALLWLLFVRLLRVPHPRGIWPDLF